MANKLLFRGQHISAIAAISFDSGLLDCYTIIGSVTGNEFLGNSSVSHHLMAIAQEVLSYWIMPAFIMWLEQ